MATAMLRRTTTTISRLTSTGSGPSAPARLILSRLLASEVEAQKVEPHAKATSTTKTFSIYRWNPDNPTKPELQDYQIDLKECGPM
ncbi:hypothetical protein CRG98_000404, partial [Punica granatum]